MTSALKNWESTGEYTSFGSSAFSLFVKKIGDPGASANKTLLLLHGFPESSYSYHAVVVGLMKIFDRIILFDMIGYGHSDKPETGYSYSLLEQADSALEVWKHLGIKGGHLLAHDMGDSVATELVARQVEGSLPHWFSDGFKSYTFTNGSMVLALSKLRITQKILLSKYGYFMKNLTTYGLFKHQVKSAHGNDNLTEEEIDCMWVVNKIKDGHRKAYLTIKYLNDRKKYEKQRWLPALSATKIPIHLCWGDDDRVARVEMAYYLKEHVCPTAKLTIMKGLGHFCQLGNPQEWIVNISSFYKP